MRQRWSDYLLTTDPGLEPIVEDELRERDTAAGNALELHTVELNPLGRMGYVGVSAGARALGELTGLRSIHHLITDVQSVPLASAEPLDVLARALQNDVSLPVLASAKTFRVTSRRTGTHPFSSMDVQRAAGSALAARYDLDADMKGFDVNVRVDVVRDTVVVGIQATREAVSKRHHRALPAATALKPNIAYAMLRFAGLVPGARVLDPCCGTGTLLIEAADAFPEVGELVGFDIDAATANGARRNIAEAARADRVRVEVADCRELAAGSADAFDVIVTDPPHGIRVGRSADMPELYARLLRGAAHVLRPGGRIVALVLRRATFRRLAIEAGFRVRRERRIENGGRTPTIVVLERPGLAADDRRS